VTFSDGKKSYSLYCRRDACGVSNAGYVNLYSLKPTTPTGSVATFSTELSRYKLELINKPGSNTRNVIQGKRIFSATVDFKNEKATSASELIIVNAPTKQANDMAPAKVSADKKRVAPPPPTAKSGVISPTTAKGFRKLSNDQKNKFCDAKWKSNGAAASGDGSVRAFPQLRGVEGGGKDWGVANKSAGSGELTPAWIANECRSHDLTKQRMSTGGPKVTPPPEPESTKLEKAAAMPSEKKQGLAWAPDIKAGTVGGIATMVLAVALAPVGASVAAYALCGLIGGFLLGGGISHAVRAYAATEKQTQ
jgi:hypothetical protein